MNSQINRYYTELNLRSGELVRKYRRQEEEMREIERKMKEFYR